MNANMRLQATWYNPGLGSCGESDSDSDLIVALAPSTMSGGKNCNKVNSPFSVDYRV